MKNCVKFKCKILCFNNYFKIVKMFVLMLISIIGVGFVSGAEIYEFFVKFGNFFWFSIILFFVLMFFLTFKILIKNNDNENMFKMQKLNSTHSKNTFLSKFKINSFLTNLCYVLMSGAMISGLKNLIKQLFLHNYILVFICSMIVVFFLLKNGVSGLAKFDVIVFVCVLFFATFCSNKIDWSAVGFKAEVCELDVINCLIMSVCYVFMNIIQVKPIVSEFEVNLTKKQKGWFSFIFSLILSSLLVLFCLFMISNSQYSSYDMPFLSYFSSKGSFLKIFFSVVLFLSLISSLMSALIGFKRVVIKKVKGNFRATILTLIFSLMLGILDFRIFVSTIYPLVGIINFVIFVFL